MGNMQGRVPGDLASPTSWEMSPAPIGAGYVNSGLLGLWRSREGKAFVLEL